MRLVVVYGRHRGQGVSNVRGRGQGGLLVLLRVKMPACVRRHQRQLLEELRGAEER